LPWPLPPWPALELPCPSWPFLACPLWPLWPLLACPLCPLWPLAAPLSSGEFYSFFCFLEGKKLVMRLAGGSAAIKANSAARVRPVLAPVVAAPRGGLGAAPRGAVAAGGRRTGRAARSGSERAAALPAVRPVRRLLLLLPALLLRGHVLPLLARLRRLPLLPLLPVRPVRLRCPPRRACPSRGPRPSTGPRRPAGLRHTCGHLAEGWVGRGWGVGCGKRGRLDCRDPHGLPSGPQAGWVTPPPSGT
jgi:hypothetical protein